MSKGHTEPLRCELGSLAIIVNSKFSINRGIIVKVVEPMGLMPWPGFGATAIPVWRVRVLCAQSAIRYHLPTKGELRQEKMGLVPDHFLRPLTPLTGQMRFEFEDYQSESDLEPMAL